jgi:selenocysteine-specific elongation factor
VIEHEAGRAERLGGVGEKVAHQLQELTSRETRLVVLGHLLRGGSPTATVGGGIVTDPLAPRRARPWRRAEHRSAESLAHFLDEAGAAGVAIAELPIRLGVTRRELDDLLAATDAWRVHDRLYARAVRDVVGAQILGTVASHHASRPLDAGAPRQWLRTRIRAPEPLVDAVIDGLVRDGRLAVEQGEIRLAEFAPRLSGRLATTAAALRERVAAAGAEPPTLDELATQLALDPADLASVARMLARDGELVAIEPGRYYARDALAGLVTRLHAGMAANADYGPAELREFVGLTRKFLIPFLEYCDRMSYTVRNDQGRRSRGVGPAP